MSAVSGHFAVISYQGEQPELHGIYSTFEDASNSIQDNWRRSPSDRAHHRPDVQEWRGDGYARHWFFAGDALVEIDLR